MLRRVERLFCRYRATGDPRALGAVFDRTAGELLRVASHLTRDPHRAEDLLQSTFLTAMEKAQQYDAGRRLLPWLLAILANHARQLHRRERRPLSAGAEATPGDVGDQAAARELTQVCDRAIDALSEPYRHVLILHLQHGLSGQEIAEALGRPDSTVRNQIARGLELLRKKLPAGIASAAVLVTASGRGLAAVRADLLARAPAGGGAAMAGVSASLGVLFMSKQIVLPLVLVAVVAGGVWYSGALAATSTPSPPASATAVGAALVAKHVEHGRAASVAGERQQVPQPSAIGDAGTGTLVAEVVVRGDGAAVADLPYTLWTPAAHGKRILAEGATLADGTARIEGLVPGEHTFELVGRPSKQAFDLVAGETRRVRLEIERGWQLQGTVVDATGRPVAGAEVRCVDELVSLPLARSAVDGTFTAPFLQGFVTVWALAAGRQPSKRQGLHPRSAAADARLVVGEPGCRLVGRVQDEQGEPVPGALVFLGLDTHAGSPFLQRQLHDIRSGPDGTFACDWLPPGNLFVGALPADGERARATAQWLELERAASVVLQLGDGARVSGQVRDDQGQPLPGVTVSSRMRDDTGLEPFDYQGMTTDAQGRFALDGLAPCRHTLDAARGEIHAEAIVVLQRRQPFAWEPTLAKGGAIALLLLGPDGGPLPSHRIELRRPDERQGTVAADWKLTDQEGRCRFEDLLPVEYTLAVLVQDYSVCIAERQAVPGGGEVVLRVDAARMPSARLSGRVVDGRGAPVREAEVFFYAGGSHGHTLRPDGDGRFATELLPPGSYSLAARSRDPARGTAGGRFEVAADQQRDVGDLVLPDTASIAVRLQAADGKPMQGAVLRLGHPRDVQPGTEDLQPDEVDGIYRKAGLDPGSFVLRFFAVDAAPQNIPLQLAPGEQRELVVVAPRAVPVVLELHCTDAGRNGLVNGLLTLVDGAGERVLLHRLWGYFDDHEHRIERVRLGLLPGSYRLHAEEYGGKTRDLELVVAATGSTAPFVVDLR